MLSLKLQENSEWKKTLVAQMRVFQMPKKDFRPKVFNLIQIIEWEITSFSKTTLLQREPCLTMLYTIQLSIARYRVYVFMLTIVLSNYSVQCL